MSCNRCVSPVGFRKWSFLETYHTSLIYRKIKSEIFLQKTLLDYYEWTTTTTNEEKNEGCKVIFHVLKHRKRPKISQKSHFSFWQLYSVNGLNLRHHKYAWHHLFLSQLNLADPASYERLLTWRLPNADVMFAISRTLLIIKISDNPFHLSFIDCRLL